METRYQVFISSTYADLKDERRAVIQTVINANCIPAGMELFPAADEKQLQFIKRVIDDCDYYLLIVGGRYGSVDKRGISYTEREYEYAVKKKLRVITLIHGSPDEIPFGKSENDPKLRKRLEKFKTRIRSGRLVKYWNSSADLPTLVAVSLANAIRQYPAIGWVRADQVVGRDFLNEMDNLRKEKENLERVVGGLRPLLAKQGLAGLEETVSLQGEYRELRGGLWAAWESQTTWGEIFGLIAPCLLNRPDDRGVNDILAAALFKKTRYSRMGINPNLDNQWFQTIGVQLRALNLVELTPAGKTLQWSLTSRGDRLMVRLRTIRRRVTRYPLKPT